MNLEAIHRISEPDKDHFLSEYYRTQKPVVLENFISDWPAHQKWNLDYIKEVAGEKVVPLYDDRPVDHKDKFNEPHARMKMKDYVDLLKREPTNFRIFLWNILKEIPELQEDFHYPDLGIRFMKGLPMLFFGGTNAYTFMHYDIDLANILHFHFDGVKECILFPQTETRYLYKVPHSLITHEAIDFSNPDYKNWPGLQYANGFKTRLKHGDALYIPEGYWHYMRYISPGFSMSLRSVAKRPRHLGKALYNIVLMRSYDNVMRKIQGKKWIDWKNEQAIKRTKKTLH